MGMSSHDFSAVVRMKHSGAFSLDPSVIEIGAQQLSNELLSNTELTHALWAAFEKDPRTFEKPDMSGVPDGHLMHIDSPIAQDLWEHLGFRYSSIDVDGSPGAIPLDLNFDGCPADKKGAYSLVTNCGTTEHIANQLNAFKVVHDLCAVGGYMMHHLPSAGYYNHGLVNYTPKFFWMLARSNAYSVLDFDYWVTNSDATGKSDLLQFIEQFKPSSAAALRQHREGDGGIFIILKKGYDIEFVPPIDVPNGAEANEELSERYWTVFRPERLRAIIEKAQDAE